MLKTDYPAAHSQDTYWYAIDDAGEVAFMSSGEDGPVPLSRAQTDFFDYLEKDEYGTPIFPTEHDFFADGQSTEELRNYFITLPENVRQVISQLALLPDLPVEERRKLRDISHKLNGVAAIVVLADAEDVKGFGNAIHVVRLDPSRAIYFVIDDYLDTLCLFIKGRVLAWKPICLDAEDDFGLCCVHGIYLFDVPFSGRYYGGTLGPWICSPQGLPPEYERTRVPNKPRTGLPASVLGGVEKEGRWARNVVHEMPGVRFREMSSVQIADSVPCYCWNEGVIEPDSGDSQVRRNMILVTNLSHDEREALAAKWRVSADTGDLIASFSLAYLYAEMHTPQGEQEVIHWLQRTAEWAENTPCDSKDMFENGSAAQCCLANFYETGNRVPIDYSMARHWYLKAASRENAIAQYQLGMMYKNGVGGPVDEAEAHRWLNTAAKQDHQEAQRVVLSFPDFNAAENGDCVAQRKLAEMYEHGRGVGQDHELSRVWYTKAAMQGDKLAQHRLGTIYKSGQLGVPPDMVQARHWFTQAAIAGDPEASFQMGMIYKHGLGVPVDLAQARDWFSKAPDWHSAASSELYRLDAIDRGDLKAWWELAWEYSKLNNHEQAFYWHRKSSEKVEATPFSSKSIIENGSAAQYILADMYEHGRGVPQDLEQALYWYGKSAEKNNYFAQYSLGMMYRNGTGVAKDIDQACVWLEKSAEQGYENAKLALQEISKPSETVVSNEQDHEKANLEKREVSVSSETIVFDDYGVIHTLRNGRQEFIQWSELEEVAIATTDEGPVADDVFLVLSGATTTCRVPNTSEGAKELLYRLQKLPGFNNERALKAMSSVENAKFICWSKGDSCSPLLALRDEVVFPGTKSQLSVGRAKSIKALKTAMECGNTIILAMQLVAAKDEPAPEDIYSIGCICSISHMLELPNGIMRVTVQGEQRALINSVVERDGLFWAEVQPISALNSTSNHLDLVAPTRRALMTEFMRCVKLQNSFSHEVFSWLEGIEDPGHLADVIAARFSLTSAQKQEILETNEISERLEKLLGHLVKMDIGFWKHGSDEERGCQNFCV